MVEGPFFSTKDTKEHEEQESVLLRVPSCPSWTIISIATNPTRLTNHVRPYSELASDLERNSVARYNFITPNVTNDMHDLAPGSLSAEKQGDDWLAHEVPKILSAAAYTNNGALFILWDEGDNEASDGPLGLILLSPLARGRAYANSLHYTHSSLLRTLQEIFGVGPWLGDAANANGLTDLFQCFCLTATARPTRESMGRSLIESE